MKIKRHYLYLDLGFFDGCNIHCDYCRKHIMLKNSTSFSYVKLVEEISAFESNYRAAVAKYSGYGEITIWKDFEKSLGFLTKKFPVVQVISNGTFGINTAKLLLKYKNVSPNLTIDGHTLAMNRHRVHGIKSLHETMLRNLKFFIDNDRDVEVNCVLHKHNIENFTKYCEYLSKLGKGRLVLFPYPVKSFDRNPQGGKNLSGNLEKFESQIDDIWKNFSQILPPKAYAQHLKAFIRDKGRHSPCYIHWANLGSGAKDERLYCPNYGETLSYGLMKEKMTSGLNRIHRQELKNLKKGKIGSGCDSCFNHFDILNSFLKGDITSLELKSTPSLNNNQVIEIAEKMKEEFKLVMAE